MRGVTHVMLLENEGSTEVGTETALAVAVDLLPGGAILEHTLQSNVVRFLPRRAGVVHVAIGRRLVRVAVELRTLEAHTLVHHAADAVAQLGERRTPGTRGADYNKKGNQPIGIPSQARCAGKSTCPNPSKGMRSLKRICTL